jgi:hypothetical protein
MSLQKVNWTKKKKARVVECLVEEAMSSEKSCLEDDGHGKMKLVKYKVKSLAWESERFSKAKKSLDDIYHDNMSKRAKDRLLPRQTTPVKENRSVPEGFPAWAVVTAEN